MNELFLAAGNMRSQNIAIPQRAAADRASGVLLHPTCLPSPYGIGDLGPGAIAWLDWLYGAGCGLWQILPLGPTGYGDSPYQGFSAMAGNPLLISPEGLLAEGLLEPGDLEQTPSFDEASVDYAEVISFKEALLGTALKRFAEGAASHLRPAYDRFRESHGYWLEDFARFMALKDAHAGSAWTDWPMDPSATGPGGRALPQRGEVAGSEKHRFRQFLFFWQWDQLRRRAAELGIRILGDVPIFVAHDSADVWSRPELYQLDDQGHPIVVAGVPPDYFSETGQLWGNPLYRWEAHEVEGYRWWIQRLKHALTLTNYLRLDHFRGFQAYWEIPAGSPTAEGGRWVEGPGSRFLDAVQQAMAGLPIVAEDLGFITPEVHALRDRFDLPGMRVLQFAFTHEFENVHLPEAYPPNAVAYTGTHDNDTSAGWYASAPAEERERLRAYLGRQSGDVAWDLLQLVWGSNANWAIAPMQDFLSLGSEARMNYPGRPEGNWRWRLRAEQLTDPLAAKIRALNESHGRLGGGQDQRSGG